MLWTPDPEIDKARATPGWCDFHHECGKVGLCFDTPGRDKNRGPFTVVAWHPRKTDAGGYQALELARATGKSLLITMRRAHDESGRGNDTTTALLERMINPGAKSPAPAEEPGDPLEGMFG